jgi:hypothetical protein
MSVPQNETILETIERRLIPDEQAKKARGEVFTPLNLVRELLYGLRRTDVTNGDLLPWGVDKDNNISEDDEDDRVGGIPLEIWRDPDSKWLDPANGIGNFPFVAFSMLDFQLKNHGTKGSKKWTDEQRHKHIVEKMLYMIEIDRGNVNTTFKVMDYLSPGAKPNICCADTLKLKDADIQRHFGVNRFHVVMGNPPFNPSRVLHDTKNTPKGTLWDKFIQFGLARLHDSGSLAFITPALWRQPNSAGGLWSVLTQTSQLVYVRIINKAAASKIFDVTQRVDMYMVQKKPKFTTTSVIDENGGLHTLDMANWPFLPNSAYEDIGPILTSKDQGIKVLYDTVYHTATHKDYVKKEKTDVYKYPIVNTITLKGLGLRYTDNTTRGHFGVPKVLLNKNENQYPHNDFKGEYGMTELTFGIPITSKEEGDSVIEAINSERFRKILKATKWGAFQTDYHMFETFRPDFYKEFLKKPEGGTRRKESKPSSRKTRRSPSRE